MPWYVLILFSHIAGAFFLFAGLALEWMAVSYLRRNLERVQVDSWIRLARIAPRCYGPALGVVLFSGGYLASKVGGNQGWILVSMVTLLVIGFLGSVLMGPRIRTMRETAMGNPKQISAALQTRLHDPMLLALVRVRVALVFGVLLLMVGKLNMSRSLVAIACALAIGMVAALLSWRRPSAERVRTA
jgi:hypothetical protein